MMNKIQIHRTTLIIFFSITLLSMLSAMTFTVFEASQPSKNLVSFKILVTGWSLFVGILGLIAFSNPENKVPLRRWCAFAIVLSAVGIMASIACRIITANEIYYVNSEFVTCVEVASYVAFLCVSAFTLKKGITIEISKIDGP